MCVSFPISLKNVQIFKGNVIVYCTKKYLFLMTFFGHVLAWTKICRLVTKHVLSSTHFHSCFFLTYLYVYFYDNNFGFQSHQTRILNAGLGMAWDRYGLSCIIFYLFFTYSLIAGFSRKFPICRAIYFAMVWGPTHAVKMISIYRYILTTWPPNNCLIRNRSDTYNFCFGYPP